MKAIVLYATRYGSTRAAAERIAAALGGAGICELNARARARGLRRGDNRRAGLHRAAAQARARISGRP